MKNVVKVVTTYEFVLDETDLVGLSKIAETVETINAGLREQASNVESAWKIDRRRQAEPKVINTGKGKPAQPAD